MVEGRVAAVERGGIDEGLEGGAGLAQRLGGAVEDARLVGEAALHGEDAAGLGVHGHEAALDRRDLAVGPVVEGAVLLDRLHEDDVADVPHVVRALGGAQAAALGGADARPARVGEGEVLALAVVLRDAVDADAGAALLEAEDHRRVPAVDVARRLGGGEGAAPARLARGVEARRVDLRHRAAVDPDGAVVFLQPVAERPRRHRLQVGVDGGADRQAAGEELVVAELGRELAADLVGEIVARRHLAAGRGDVAGLDRQQVLGLGRLGRLAGDVAVVGHLIEHVVAAGDGAGLFAHRVQHARRLRQRGEVGGLGERELLERLGEVGLRRGGDAIGVLAEEDLVEVELEDLVLGERALEPGGEDDLLDLALAGAVAGQEEVLHHLLGDRRGAAQAPAVHRRVVERRHDAARVEAVVLVEVLVLGGDEGLPDLVGDLVDRREDAPLAGELVHERALAGVDAAERRRLVALELGVVGQVLAVDGDDGGEAGEAEHGCHRGPAEQEAEKPEDQSEHDSGSIAAGTSLPDPLGKGQKPPRSRRCQTRAPRHQPRDRAPAPGGRVGPGVAQ